MTSNPYFIFRDGVLYTDGKPVELSNPYKPPEADPGPGMKWVWDSSKTMWMAVPAFGGATNAQSYDPSNFTSFGGAGGVGMDASGIDGSPTSGGFSGVTSESFADVGLGEASTASGGAPAGTAGETGVSAAGEGDAGGPGSGGGADGPGEKRGGLIHRYALGGISSLGGYSDGGRLLRGPGDGVSDSIPATIGDRRPARLADGEFVVPARIVSELGNGSTEAGARKLYAMMDRVQKARGKTTGKGRVAVNSRADKHLPA